jgi:peptidoglycan/LPS O-acetylase OafA/YrhL
VSVILLHATSIVVAREPHTSAYWEVYWFINRAAAFSAPLFFTISGAALTARYIDEEIDLVQFWKHRARRLLPSYTVWTLVYFLYAARVECRTWPSLSVFLGDFAVKWISGRAFAHLYFIIALFQLSLLFPLLLKFLKRFRRYSQLLLLLVAVAIQVTWAVISPWRPRWSDHFFVAYLPFFLAGCLAVINIDEFKRLGRDYLPYLMVTFVLLMPVQVLPNALGPLAIITHRVFSILYSLVAFWLFFALSTKYPWPRARRYSGFVFDVYLAHPIIMTELTMRLIPLGVNSTAEIVAIRFLSGLVLPVLFSKVIRVFRPAT